MKVPLGWLREYVDLALSPAQLAERLTLGGLEVTGVRVYGLPVPDGLKVKAEDAGPVWAPDQIMVGEILSVEQHPNADRLTLATIAYGAAQPRTVVTGATNIKVGDKGQKVILALSGAVLFDGHADERVLRELKPSKIRGVPSDAMVCSAYELGISDEHAGIILLENDAPVGQPLAEFMGEIVLDIDVLPNMARCLSMVGIARETAALTGQTLKLPPRTLEATGAPIEGQVRIEIEDPKLSARYAALLIRDIKIDSGPGWMQRRLTYAGMRPISNVVDITNYVMLEWGQPLHAFDYDSLVRRAGGKAPTITVRPARAGERLRTLDNVDRPLTPDDVIIADEGGPVAIAGVMGGAETEVADTSRNILLESANFNFLSVRRTMKQLNLPSEASARFSRGIHPEVALPAAERAAELMRRHAAGKVAKGVVDRYPAPPAPVVVDLDMNEVRRILGMDFKVEDATRILSALEFKVEPSGPGRLRVTAPPHRLDIQVGSADLIEELARVYGYDRLPAMLMADELPEQHVNHSYVLEDRARDALVDLGLQETMTYSLTEPGREAPLGAAEGDYVRLVNPISAERTVLRHTVLAGLIDVAAANLRHTEEVCLFEVGPVYRPTPGEKLPREPRRLALFLTGHRSVESWAEAGQGVGPALDFFDLKGVIEGLLGDLHVAPITYRPSSAPYLHPGRSAEVLVRGKPVGHIGQMHPRTAEGYGLGSRTVLVGELDLEAILAAVPERFTYTPVPRFPPALRDVAVIVPADLPAERVAAEIRVAGGDLLKGVRLFDVYKGEAIPTGTKSLAYALTYQPADRTLTDKEVDKAHKKIEDRLKHVLKAQIRGQ
jgi:phenylalanyl-tRNA synthetase beta chain